MSLTLALQRSLVDTVLDILHTCSSAGESVSADVVQAILWRLNRVSYLEAIGTHPFSTPRSQMIDVA